MPITGSPVAALTAAMSSAPSARIPIAPAAAAACAMAAMKRGPRNGLPSAAWHDTTSPDSMAPSAVPTMFSFMRSCLS